MNKQQVALLLMGALSLSGCVSVRSNREPGAEVPAFDNILVVLKQKNDAQRYADEYRFAFPPGYQVTTLGIDDLTFGNQDSLVHKNAQEASANAVLWLENRPTGTVTGTQYYTVTDFELYGELRVWPANRPIWKAKVLKAPVRGHFPPSRVVSQLLRDGVLNKRGPALTSAAAISFKTP